MVHEDWFESSGAMLVQRKAESVLVPKRFHFRGSPARQRNNHLLVSSRELTETRNDIEPPRINQSIVTF
jgi:hypothetical protein